jgi:hypothetical protein
MTKLLLSLLLIPLALGQSASSVASLPSFDADAEEPVIYSTVINSLSDITASRLLVIVSSTITPFDIEYLLKDYNQQQPPNLLAQTLNDYRRKVQQNHDISLPLDLKNPFEVLSREEHEQIFKDGCSGWCEFYKKYPDNAATIALSRIGFNRQGTQALVFMSYGCGGLCGYGGFIMLEKQQGAWRVQKWLAGYVS